MALLSNSSEMEIDFSEYQQIFSEEDYILLKDLNVYKLVVFRQKRNRITVVLSPPNFENYLSVYFSLAEADMKFTISLFNTNYHNILLQLLNKYNLGSSKIIQLDIFSKIQKYISTYYIDLCGCKYLYRERSKTSPFYVLTILLDFSTVISICEIDEDNLIENSKKRISNLVSKDIISGANINYVYLQYNRKSNLYKIGFSKKPEYREKTLQSEEPDIRLFRKWICSQKYEGILKAKFRDKRKRGEWFDLSHNDIVEIDEQMNGFYNDVGTAITGLTTQLIGSLKQKGRTGIKKFN